MEEEPVADSTVDEPGWIPSAKEMQQLCGLSVTVHLDDVSTRHGVVYTIDPVSHSVVLVQFEGDATGKDVLPTMRPSTVVVVPGQSIAGVTSTSTERADLTHLFPSNISGVTMDEPPEVVARRREKLLDWLKKNRLPVQVLEGVRNDVNSDLEEAYLCKVFQNLGVCGITFSQAQRQHVLVTSITSVKVAVDGLRQGYDAIKLKRPDNA